LKKNQLHLMHLTCMNLFQKFIFRFWF
jgi:hypothetical protein